MTDDLIYLIGSLRNPEVPKAASKLRAAGFEVFDDWYAAGPEADDYWQTYEQLRGHSFVEALQGHHAKHVFQFDFVNLNRATRGVLLLPAGKSGHLELGYLRGQGKLSYIVLPEEPERYDVMYGFAHGVFLGIDALIEHLMRGDG